MIGDFVFPQTKAKMSDLLPSFGNDLIGSLISFSTHESVLRLTSRYPVDLSDFLCYELHLVDKKPKADFLFCINDPDLFYTFLQDQKLSYKLNESEQNRLDHLYRFATNWLSATARQSIKNIWFEYDECDLNESIVVPNFFLAPSSDISFLKVLPDLLNSFNELIDEDVSSDIVRELVDIIYKLKDLGQVTQIGKMHARGDDDHLRLLIQNMDLEKICDFLVTIDYPLLPSLHIDHWISTLKNYSRKLDFDIDIGNPLGKKLGIECYFGNSSQVAELIQWLEERGLCHHEKAKCIKKILSNGIKSFRNGYSLEISHLKINFQSDGPFDSKLYVGLKKQKIKSI